MRVTVVHSPCVHVMPMPALVGQRSNPSPCAFESVVRQTPNDVVLVTESRFEESKVSPTLVVTIVVPDSLSLVGNTHSIVTWAKASICKPKIFSIEF